MSPHADFACNSKTCKTKKGATVYDLPVKATRCPVCGSKRIIRLFNAAPHISTGKAKRIDSMMEPEHIRQQRQRDDAKTAQRTTPMLAASLKGGLAGAVAEGMEKSGYRNMPVPVPVIPQGVAKPTAGITSPLLAGAKAAGMVRVVPHTVNKDSDQFAKSTGGTG